MAERSAYDELTRALTQIMLGGQTPEAVEMGTGVRPGFGLGGASISTAKSPYEPTLAPGEWEQMTPEQRQVRTLGQLFDMALGAGAAVGAPTQMPGIGGGGAPAMRAPASARPRPSGLPVPGGQLTPSQELAKALAEATNVTATPRRPSRPVRTSTPQEPIETITLYSGGTAAPSDFWSTRADRAGSYGPKVFKVEVPLDVFLAGQAKAAKLGQPTRWDTVLPNEWVKKGEPLE